FGDRDCPCLRATESATFPRQNVPTKVIVDNFFPAVYKPTKVIVEAESMPRQKSERITPLELEVLHVLWEKGTANVQTVQRELKRDLAYTTVQTMLTVLHRKGKVKRTLKDKAY